MKTLLLFVLATALVRAESSGPVLPTATITADTKLELTKTKGTIGLKAGTKVDVIGQEGDSLSVLYRNLPGLVPLSKTDFKGAKTKPATTAPATEPKAHTLPATTPPAAKPVEKANTTAKPPTAAPAASTAATPSPGPREPTTNYGKAVKKARDVTATHQETMVAPTDEVVTPAKKE
ncbi:MAG TPA: hypothetical protein VHO24_01630 [Opitutaceae bacterium]|nr:hypothetical protein [Opitutaceae bacterium]